MGRAIRGAVRQPTALSSVRVDHGSRLFSGPTEYRPLAALIPPDRFLSPVRWAGQEQLTLETVGAPVGNRKHIEETVQLNVAVPK